MQINQLIIAMPLRPVAAGAYRADHSMHWLVYILEAFQVVQSAKVAY